MTLSREQLLAGLAPAALMAAGAVLSGPAMGGAGWYWPAAAVSTAMAAGLSMYLYPRGRAAACAWLGLGVFLCFGYLKFFWLARDASPAAAFFPARALGAFSSRELLLSAFLLQTASFAAFAAAVVLSFSFLERLAPGPGKREPVPPAPPGPLGAAPLALIPVLAGAAMWAIGKFKIGVLGMPSVPMPFHLAGVVFYFHTIFIPSLFLLQISSASRAGEEFRARAGILLFFLWGCGDMLLRNSRAGIFLVPLLLLFLAVSGGLKVKKAELLSGLLMLGLAVLSAPVATQYRYLRMGGEAPLAALKLAAAGYGAAARAVLGSAGFIFFRIPGIETTILVLGLVSSPLWGASLKVMFTGAGLAGYLSETLLGIPPESHMAVAASFIAGSYLAGGGAGVVLASFAAGALSVAVFPLVGLLAARTAEVGRALALLLFFWLTTEGFSPMFLKQAAAACLSVVLFELFFRRRAGAGA